MLLPIIDCIGYYLFAVSHSVNQCTLTFLAHLSRRLVGEVIVYSCSGVRPSVVRPSVVRPSSTISSMNISATSGPITMKLYQKHHWDRGKVALGFVSDQIQTMVSMATNSSHRVIMEKRCCHFFSAVFHPILFIFAGNDNMHESPEEFEIQPDPTTDCGVSCP